MKNENHDGAIGMRLEEMYHTAVSIHDLAAKAIASLPRGCEVSFVWAIQELARGQARELEVLAEHFGGSELGYYASHFEEDDAALIVANMKQGAPT